MASDVLPDPGMVFAALADSRRRELLELLASTPGVSAPALTPGVLASSSSSSRRRESASAANTMPGSGSTSDAIYLNPRARSGSSPREILLGTGAQAGKLILPAARVALPLVLAQRLGQVEPGEAALDNGHADLVADRPDVDLDHGRVARHGLGTAERTRPAERDIPLRLDADHIDHVGPVVAAVSDRDPSRNAGRLGVAARQPPAGPRDKLPYLVLRRSDGDLLFDTVFHDPSSLGHRKLQAESCTSRIWPQLVGPMGHRRSLTYLAGRAKGSCKECRGRQCD